MSVGIDCNTNNVKAKGLDKEHIQGNNFVHIHKIWFFIRMEVQYWICNLHSILLHVISVECISKEDLQDYVP